MSRARKLSSKRPALVKHYLLEKCQHLDWIPKGEKTQYNLRNFWLFNPKSEELLISLLCPKVCPLQYCSHSNTNTNRHFELEMLHFYLFIFSLFFKVGEDAVGLCVPRLLVPTGRRPSQRLQTSSYTRSELLWQPQVFCNLGLKFIYDNKNWKKEEVPWWLCARNPLLEKILKACGKQIKTLIYNVFADYRSIVDCHNIIARWGSIGRMIGVRMDRTEEIK